MVSRSFGNLGCFVLILVAILIMSLLSLSWTIIFRTPVGLLILGYLIYRYYKKNKEVGSEEPVEFNQDSDEIVDVDYADVNSDDEQYYDDYE